MDYQLALNQLTYSNNGYNRLKIMLGAYNFVRSNDDNTITFLFKMCKHSNRCSLTLTNDDLYTLEFSKLRLSGKNIGNVKQTNKISGLYCEQLFEIFEGFTGLALKL